MSDAANAAAETWARRLVELSRDVWGEQRTEAIRGEVENVARAVAAVLAETLEPAGDVPRVIARAAGRPEVAE